MLVDVWFGNQKFSGILMDLLELARVLNKQDSDNDSSLQVDNLPDV